MKMGFDLTEASEIVCFREFGELSSSLGRNGLRGRSKKKNGEVLEPEDV